MFSPSRVAAASNSQRDRTRKRVVVVNLPTVQSRDCANCASAVQTPRTSSGPLGPPLGKLTHPRARAARRGRLCKSRALRDVLKRTAKGEILRASRGRCRRSLSLRARAVRAAVARREADERCHGATGARWFERWGRGAARLVGGYVSHPGDARKLPERRASEQARARDRSRVNGS